MLARCCLYAVYVLRADDLFGSIGLGQYRRRASNLISARGGISEAAKTCQQSRAKKILLIPKDFCIFASWYLSAIPYLFAVLQRVIELTGNDVGAIINNVSAPIIG